MHLYENPNSLLTMQHGHTQMKTSDLCLNNHKKNSVERFQIDLSEITQMQKWFTLQYIIQFIHLEGIFRFQSAKFQEIGIKLN